MINPLNTTNPGVNKSIAWHGPSGVPGRVAGAAFIDNAGNAYSIGRFNTVTNATAFYNSEVAKATANAAVRNESPNAWARSAYQTAAGHAPATQRVTTNAWNSGKGGRGVETHMTWAQYDTVVVQYTYVDTPARSS